MNEGEQAGRRAQVLLYTEKEEVWLIISDEKTTEPQLY
jgi:hypothetical protein